MSMTYVKHKTLGFVISVDETDGHGGFIGTLVDIPSHTYADARYDSLPALGGRNDWRMVDFEPCQQPFFNEENGAHIAQDCEDRADELQGIVDALCRRLDVPSQPRRKVGRRMIERVEALLALETQHN